MSGPFQAAFEKLRADGQARVGSTLAGVALGLVAAWFHPVGLVVGGALTALPQRGLGRGIAAGLGFGVCVVAVNLALVGLGDGLAGVSAALAMRQVTGVSTAFALAGGLVGGLVRGVV